jgi:hypothetical protein
MNAEDASVAVAFPPLVDRAIDDILRQFSCAEHVDFILPSIRQPNAAVFNLYRSHLTRKISALESKYRTAVDELLEMCSLLSIVSGDLAGALCRSSQPGEVISEILRHAAIERYMTIHYSMIYGLLARADLEGRLSSNLLAADRRERADEGWSLALQRFLSLNAQLLSDDSLLDFLFLLDDHFVANTHIAELQKAFDSKARMKRWLAPRGRDQLLDGLARLLNFAEALHALLDDLTAFPVLRGRIWLHYSYWLGHGGPRVRETMAWVVHAIEKTDADDKTATAELLQATFRDLTDPRRFASELLELARPIVAALPGLEPPPIEDEYRNRPSGVDYDFAECHLIDGIKLGQTHFDDKIIIVVGRGEYYAVDGKAIVYQEEGPPDRPHRIWVKKNMLVWHGQQITLRGPGVNPVTHDEVSDLHGDMSNRIETVANRASVLTDFGGLAVPPGAQISGSVARGSVAPSYATIKHYVLHAAA